MAKVKHGVTVNIKCKDCTPKYGRCTEEIDARCVIYKGKENPSIPANPFDDLERVVENLTKLVDEVIRELTNLEEDFNNDKENIDSVLSEKQLEAEGIDERIDDVNDRLTDLENRLCQLVENCPIIQQAVDRIDYILENFCLITTGCVMGKGFPWVTDENKSGCSYSNTEYIPAYGVPTERVYYVETQKISDSSHPHYGQERVIWIPNKDQECA